jgi:hypothetical protein
MHGVFLPNHPNTLNITLDVVHAIEDKKRVIDKRVQLEDIDSPIQLVATVLDLIGNGLV